MLKSIAVMTSGGDSPGMNAAVRAVTRTALHHGVRVWGIRGGYHGMLDEEIFEMQSKDVSDIIQRGGTFLGTARCKRFATPEGRMLGYKNLVDRGIQGLVVVGGDGSLRGASILSQETGIPIVGLPGTIDNARRRIQSSTRLTSSVTPPRLIAEQSSLRSWVAILAGWLWSPAFRAARNIFSFPKKNTTSTRFAKR